MENYCHICQIEGLAKTLHMVSHLGIFLATVGFKGPVVKFSLLLRVLKKVLRNMIMIIRIDKYKHTTN